MTRSHFTAVYKKSGRWYIGWVEEIPGVNTQGRTLKETRANLQEALTLILEMNKAFSRAGAARKDYIREPIAVSV